MIRRTPVLFCLSLALAAIAPTAQAQLSGLQPLEQFAYPVLPTPGVFYDPAQSGTGLTVDRVVAGGNTFIFSTYYHYGANGEPTWLNLAAPVTQATIAQYTADGRAAWVQSEWLRAAGGQCFDCAFTAPTVTTPPYGVRQLELIGGRYLRLPASGNAANRNMQLAKALVPDRTPSQRLLEKGSVWAVKHRYGISQAGDGEGGSGGWVYFVKRPTAEKVRFEGNTLGLQEPAFLRLADRNAPDQYEARKAIQGYTTLPTAALQTYYGKGNGAGIIADWSTAWDRDEYTFLIDPATDRIRMLGRCVPSNGGETPACPTGIDRTRAIVTSVSDVIDAGPNEAGQERIVIRVWNMFKGDGSAFWESEYELTRVPDEVARALVPTLPAGIATGAQ